jgi:hypothetical protein
MSSLFGVPPWAEDIGPLSVGDDVSAGRVTRPESSSRRDIGAAADRRRHPLALGP